MMPMAASWPVTVRGPALALFPEKCPNATRDEDIAALAELLEVSVDYINEQLGAAWVTDDVFRADPVHCRRRPGAY